MATIESLTSLKTLVVHSAPFAGTADWRAAKFVHGRLYTRRRGCPEFECHLPQVAELEIR